jgi:hypothetical protein
MTSDNTLRDHLVKLLAWEDAHVSFDTAVADLPVRSRGSIPSGLPYSPWQILEHLRLTQRDILEFCINSNYVEQEWPADYWPKTPRPPSDDAWDASVQAFRKDRSALEKLARDPAIQLEERIPHGDGQTYLRELLLAADHAAYHVGEMVVVRRILGVWTRS